MLTKTCPAEFKAIGTDDEPGTYEAIVSVFGNVDHGGDRVLKGAFKANLAAWKERGDPIPVVWSHQWGDPFAVIGATVDIAEKPKGLWVKGQLDIDGNEQARQVYRLMQQRLITQFSFSYDIVDADWVKSDNDEENGPWGLGVQELKQLDIFEHGPCFLGMNAETDLLAVKAGMKEGRALSTKNEERITLIRDTADDILADVAAEKAAAARATKAAIGPHGTTTDDREWDAGANLGRIPGDASAATLRRMHAWVDSDGDAETKSAYKFPHHFVDTDGSVGSASTVAASASIAALNGARGGANIPSGDRQGVYNHARRHLIDGGRDPADVPELASAADLADEHSLLARLGDLGLAGDIFHIEPAEA